MALCLTAYLAHLAYLVGILRVFPVTRWTVLSKGSVESGSQRKSLVERSPTEGMPGRVDATRTQIQTLYGGTLTRERVV